MSWDLDTFCSRHGLDASAANELRDALDTMVDPDDSLLDGGQDRAPTRLPDAPHLALERLLGRGAMGEVWLAHDERLSRPVAVKLLGGSLAHDPAAQERFLAEAQATAQLVHPGIVPVHEVGTWRDGRPFYTMDVIRGQTLTAQIEALHDGGGDPDPGELERLVDRLRRACEAVGYAHSRGVVHRDLKPDNLMVGAFGEVLVADWGLVRAAQEAATPAEPVQTGRRADLTHGLAGTPRYMSPEQVSSGDVGPASDVFSLGAILVIILDGRPAFPQETVHHVLAAVATGRVRLPTAGPQALRDIAERALRTEPADRYADAGSLAEALGDYLAGAERRTRALAEVQAGLDLEPRIAALRAELDAARAAAEAAMADVKPWMDAEAKLDGWRLEDHAAALEKELGLLEEQRIEHFEGALFHDGELPEALSRLAEHHRARVEAAEAVRDQPAAARAERSLRRYDRGQHAAFLEGKSRLSLVTDPPGATVTCRRYELVERRLVPVDPVVLGTTPLVEVVLPMGDYELTLQMEGYAPATYPVSLRRQHHWDGVKPGEREPFPVKLLRPDELGPDDCYVPGGWCWRGATNVAFTADEPHLAWVDPFVMRRFPVTNREYIAFLDDLLRTKGEEEALKWVPRERSSSPGVKGPMCYGRNRDGTFVLVPDADGDLWDLDWPVMLVDWHSARAFAAWEAQRTGQPWRLARVDEWEKAGRGADARAYPWGGPADPALMCIRSSHEERPTPVTVHAYPTDRSPYGICGLAGNMRDWCDGEMSDDQRPIRGGCWFFPATGAHLAAQFHTEAHRLGDTVGFRLSRTT